MLLQLVLKFQGPPFIFHLINLFLFNRQSHMGCFCPPKKKSPKATALFICLLFFFFAQIRFFSALALDSKKSRAPRSTQVAVSRSGAMRIDSPLTSNTSTSFGPQSGKQETHTAGTVN